MKVFHYFNFKQHSRKHYQRGFHIGPALGSLFLYTMVAVAIYGTFQFIRGGTSVNIENTNLMTIVSGAKSLKSGGSYANVDNEILQRIKAFGSMTGSATGGTVRNGWNGTVVVTGTASQLSIQYNGVPSSACDRFLAAASGTGEFATPLPTCNASTDSDLAFVAY